MRIRSAKAVDLSVMADICRDAFMDDRFFNWMHPYRREYPEDFRAYFLHSLKKYYYGGTSNIMVAETDESDVDWSGRPVIMGFSGWKLEDKRHTSSKWSQSGVYYNITKIQTTL